MPPRTAAVTALVPLRAGGKTRLADALDAEQRTALAWAMLSDVAAALAAGGVERVVGVAQGASAVAAARAAGLDVVADPPGTTGLDAALRHAAAAVAPAGPLLVATADLPRLRGREVADLLARDGAVVVAPTLDGGTGALLRRPAGVVPTAFGGRSAPRHLALAARAGVPAGVVHADGWARDVDTLADLAALAEAPAVGPATAAVLAALPRPGHRAAG